MVGALMNYGQKLHLHVIKRHKDAVRDNAEIKMLFYRNKSVMYVLQESQELFEITIISMDAYMAPLDMY